MANRRATLRLTLRSPNGPDLEIDALIDSGFSGYLTLPPTVVSAFALPFSHLMNAFFADGSFHLLRVHLGTVLWKGKDRGIEVVATGKEVLIGMTLLEGSEVRFQVVEGGTVTIIPL